MIIVKLLTHLQRSFDALSAFDLYPKVALYAGQSCYPKQLGHPFSNHVSKRKIVHGFVLKHFGFDNNNENAVEFPRDLMNVLVMYYCCIDVHMLSDEGDEHFKVPLMSLVDNMENLGDCWQ